MESLFLRPLKPASREYRSDWRDKKMKRFFLAFTLVCFALFGLDRPLEAAGPVVVASPDGAIKAELTSADGVLRYRVTEIGRASCRERVCLGV